MFWYSLFTTLSFFGTIVTVLFAWLAWRLRKRHIGALTCMVMLLAIAAWTSSYAMEQVVSTLNAKIFWHKFSYLGIPVVPAAWFLFNAQISRLIQQRTRLWIALLSIEPLLLWVIAWSPFDEWIWSGYTLATIANYPTPILEVAYGPLFAIHTGFTYLLFLAGTILYARHLLRTMFQSPEHILWLILSVLTPFVVNVLRIAGVSPFSLFDLTPIALSTIGATAAWYIFRFPLRDLLMLAQREVLAQIGDGVLVLDQQNRVTNLNAAAQTMLGKSEEEVLRQPIELLLPGSTLAIHRHLQTHVPPAAGQRSGRLNAPPAEVERITIKLKMRRPLTRLFSNQPLVDDYEETAHIEISIFPLLDQRPFVNGCVLVLRDVTPQARAEEELHALDRRYQNLVEMVPDAILVGDPRLVITNCNRRAAELYGVADIRNVFGKRLVDLLAESDVARFLSNVYRMIETQQNHSDIYLLRQIDGKALEVELHMTLVRDPQNLGMPLGFLAVMRNVTERLRQEEANNRIQKIESIGLLASGLSHDFNNLLTGMMTQGSIALKQSMANGRAGGERSGEVQRHVQQMMQLARHAANLSQQLAAYSGRETPEVEPLDFDALVGECIELLSATLPSTIHLQPHLQTDPFAVEADRRQLQLVVQNLVLKAVDAIEEQRLATAQTQTAYVFAYPQKIVSNEGPYDWIGGPQLTSHYEQDGDQIFVQQNPLKEGQYLCLAVSAGALEDELAQAERLFQPEFTATSSGRGLGLSVLLGIVRAHDGGLEVERRANSHSIFRIYLPAVQAPAASESKSAAASTLPTLSGSALIVDDDTVVRETLAEALTFLGMHTTEATNGREGVDLYMEQKPRFDIVLLDVKMPVMDGTEALTILRAFDSQARVLLTSGYTGKSSLEDLLQSPTVQFLHKPYNLDELASSLKELLQM